MCYTVKSIDDVRSLVAAARGLAGLVDLDTLASRACRETRALLDVDFALISACRQSDLLELVAADGLEIPSAAAEQRRGRGLGWLAADLDDTPTVRIDEPCRVLEDTPTGPLDQSLVCRLEHDPVIAIVTSHGARFLTACPIRFGGITVGCLFVARRTDEADQRRTAELLWELAASIAPLMMRAVSARRAGEVAVVQERATIAQHLHDTAGQALFTISLAAQGLRESLTVAAYPRTAECVDQTIDIVAAADTVKRIEHAAAEASTYLREAMHTLLPPSEALDVGLRREVQAFKRRSRIPAETIILGTPVATSDSVDETILLVVREGLNNIERHANASSVSVTLSYRPEDVVVLVQDDGDGLANTPVATALPGKIAALGIPNLRHRVEAHAGQLCLSDSEDGGTGLLVTLPLGLS